MIKGIYTIELGVGAWGQDVVREALLRFDVKDPYVEGYKPSEQPMAVVKSLEDQWREVIAVLYANLPRKDPFSGAIHLGFYDERSADGWNRKKRNLAVRKITNPVAELEDLIRQAGRIGAPVEDIPTVDVMAILANRY